MINKKIKRKIYYLRKKILKYNNAYYNLNCSKISDNEYDKMFNELNILENKYNKLYDIKSPIYQVGIEVKNKPISYKYKMYSIKNVYSKKELKLWITKISKIINNFSIICELKYDGVSINLIYKKGILTNAITRGNGTIGEDVTRNIKKIKYIPYILKDYNLPEYLEIRGEIYIKKKNFIKLNKYRIKNGVTPYYNPRNTASGIIKMIKKHNLHNFLSFVAFNVLGINYSQHYSIEKLKNWGFKVPKRIYSCRINDFDKIDNFINFWESKKNHYQIDGIVIKINEYENKIKLGFTQRYPKWAIAYKFHQNASETKLTNITYQVGRTGIITPVAHISPIYISGTIIKKVALYNNNFIQKKKIHYGDTFFIKKGGDIIPKVTKINISKRIGNTIPIFFLKTCPSCKNRLIKEKKLFFCKNKYCTYQNIMKLKHFVSSKAMNIKKIGIETIKKLYKNKVLKNLYDFFILKTEDLIKINGINEKLAKEIIFNIEKSKTNTYQKFLFALGIRHVGEDISRKLTDTFKDINHLLNANYNKLISITGIGHKIAKSIIEYFSNYENKNNIDMLYKYGVNFSKQNKNTNYDSSLIGKYFIFTGKLSCMTRNEAINCVELVGGKVSNTINNKINFIVVGNNFGSKLEKSIKKNNIKILTENNFLKMITKK